MLSEHPIARFSVCNIINCSLSVTMYCKSYFIQAFRKILIEFVNQRIEYILVASFVIIIRVNPQISISMEIHTSCNIVILDQTFNGLSFRLWKGESPSILAITRVLIASYIIPSEFKPIISIKIHSTADISFITIFFKIHIFTFILGLFEIRFSKMLAYILITIDIDKRDENYVCQLEERLWFFWIVNKFMQLLEVNFYYHW